MAKKKQTITFDLVSHDGRPIEVLNRLVERRCKVMNQSRRHVTAAIAITALKSIRALTSKGKGKVLVK